MLGREVEGDAVLRIAQEGFAGRLGSKHTRLAFDSELDLEAAEAGNKAHDGLGEVDVEVVADDVAPCVGGGVAQQAAEKTCEILFGSGVADHALDLAGGDVEGGDEGLS